MRYKWLGIIDGLDGAKAPCHEMMASTISLLLSYNIVPHVFLIED